MQIYDRDGFTLGEFLKGDMYIRDLKNTKGHISGLTAGQWHPKDRETALTASEDGSLRIWDVNDFKTQKQVSTAINPIRTWSLCSWEHYIEEVYSMQNIRANIQVDKFLELLVNVFRVH